MTFHFPHMAPPGATPPRTILRAVWMRDAKTGALRQHWCTDARAVAPDAAPLDAQLRALVSRHAELRTG